MHYQKAKFIAPMLLLRTEKLPEGPEWLVELKLDGYRSLAIKTRVKAQLRSRNDKDFTARYSSLVNALSPMPDETVLDGEVVGLDAEGRPCFNALQNYPSSGRIRYEEIECLDLSSVTLLHRPIPNWLHQP